MRKSVRKSVRKRGEVFAYTLNIYIYIYIVHASVLARWLLETKPPLPLPLPRHDVEELVYVCM